MAIKKYKIPSIVTLSAIFEYPESSSADTALLVLLHGHTGWKEELHLESLSKTLTEHGISCLRFDCPGIGESDGTIKDSYRVSNYITACNDVISWAMDNLPTNPKKIFIAGHSKGGLVAIQVASTNPVIKACVGIQASGAVPVKAAELVDTVMQTEIFGNVTIPKEYFIDRAKYSSVSIVKDLNIPLLLIAGSHDLIVPAEQVQQIFAAANEPREYSEYAVDHDYKNDPKNLAEINSDIVNFLLKV